MNKSFTFSKVEIKSEDDVECRYDGGFVLKVGKRIAEGCLIVNVEVVLEGKGSVGTVTRCFRTSEGEGV